MTDVLGVMESWSEGTTVVRTEAGDAVAIPLAEVVAGKPVPPRPSPRLRVTPESAQRRAAETWPAITATPLGAWLLRDSRGFSGRGSSALAVGDPGLPVPAALREVVAFYAERAQPAWAQVVVGSGEADAVVEAGWVRARPARADVQLRLGATARALRTAARLRPPAVPAVSLSGSVSEAWLADDARARAYGDAARAVLEGPAAVVFAVLGDPVVAKGRCALTEDGEWAGLTDLWVSPGSRRRGLACAVMTALLDWAAERGATTTCLHVEGDNAAATALYDRLGLQLHHSTRYLTPPGVGLGAG
jgi:ribosomal protein S18 acetylase RimI-like enzyme